ncbi:MAG: PadR family transcriptional regulator [Lysobacterales bacterium]
MSLPHILLGMLHQPASGYQLKQDFSQSLRHFWFADLAQIYPTLHKLEHKGQVRSQSVASDKGPPQRVYRRTADGTKALQCWVSDDPITGRERFPYLAQIMFLGENADRSAQIRYFEKLCEFFESKVAALKAIDADWRGKAKPEDFADEDLFPWFTLDVGIVRNEATVRWCRRSLELIRNR